MPKSQNKYFVRSCINIQSVSYIDEQVQRNKKNLLGILTSKGLH